MSAFKIINGILWAVLIIGSILTTGFILFINSGCASIEKPASAIPSIQQAQDVTAKAVDQLDQIGPLIHQEVAQARPEATAGVNTHLDAIDAAASAVGDVSASLKTGVTPALAVATENAKATEKALASETKRANAAEEREKSLIRQILAIVAIAGLVGGIVVIAYGAYSKSTKIGIWGGAIMAGGAAAAVLYQYYTVVLWVGGGLVLATIGYLVYMLFRQTGVAKNLVANVETIKAELTPEQTITLFGGQKGAVPETQTPATKALVQAVKPAT